MTTSPTPTSSIGPSKTTSPSPQIPGLRIPGAPFMGIAATAPSQRELAAWTAREQRLIDRGRFALPPDSAGAVPDSGGPAAPPEVPASQRFLAVMGMPLNADDENESENLTLAARNAVHGMIELLQERGFTRQQAYVICSVAVDLRISNAVDLPNVVVSAFLPEAIFDDA